MESITIMVGVAAFLAGMLWHAFIMRAGIKIIMKRFSDEMHRQYLMLLEKNGIKLNKVGKEFLDSIED